MATFVEFKKADDELQIVYSEVYAPGVPDSHGDYMEADDIRIMAHRFLVSKSTAAVDTNHDLQANGSYIVESFIAREGDPIFIPGSWVVGVHVPDPEKWAMVKSGELNGFSMYGAGTVEEQVFEVEVPDVIEGETTEAEGHTHKFFVKYSDDGEFLGGYTDEAEDGHTHTITHGTFTSESNGHKHNFSFLDNLGELLV